MADTFNQPGREPLPAEPATRGEPGGSRFETCRWRTAPDDGASPYCAHRDVLPYAGTNGFNPGAWCPDCRFFKKRRGTGRRSDPLADDF